MGLLNTHIEITLCSATIKHYENLGYNIPREKNKWRKLTVPRNTKLLVKVCDLQPCSSVLLDAECDECKKQYKIYYENYQKTNRNGKIYCKSCAKRLFNSNINNPNYKIDISLEGRACGRFSPGYSNFVKRVLARDDYTCQCCKKHKNEINILVHHLDGYNWCKEKRTDDTNGITLCENCHKSFHGKYGNGNNTKEQFEEWLGCSITNLKEYDGEICTARKIYCYEEGKIYDNVMHFIKQHNIKNTSAVYRVCNGAKKYKTVKGFHLFWHDEYVCMSDDKLKTRLNNTPIRPTSKPVICLTTGRIYKSICEGSRCENVSATSISNCCEHKQEKVLSLQDNRITQWMYYDKY